MKSNSKIYKLKHIYLIKWLFFISIIFAIGAHVGIGNAFELRNGNMKDMPFERPLDINTRAKVLAIGSDISVGVKNDGTVWTWGTNQGDLLARSIKTQKAGFEPGQVPGLRDIYSVSAGLDHVLALGRDGSVIGWGLNNFGELGCSDGAGPSYGDNSFRAPQIIPGISDVVDMYAANKVSFFVKKEGSVWVCGRWLGHKNLLPPSRLSQIPGLMNIVRVWGHPGAAFALDRQGNLFSFGVIDAFLGRQVSDAPEIIDERPYKAPARIELPGKVVDLALTVDSIAALLADGTVWTWGSNLQGGLGNKLSPQSKRMLPERVMGLSRIKVIGADFMSSFAVTHDNVIFWWGGMIHGQRLGPGTSRHMRKSAPVLLKKCTSVEDAYGGLSAFAYRDADGGFWYWGRNVSGIRGNGSEVDDVGIDYLLTPEKSKWVR